MKAPSNRLLVVSYGSLTSYSELNCLEFSFCQQNLENSRFCRENRENSRFCRKNLDCKTVRIFSYSSTREQSNKRSGTRLKTEIEESRACEARTKLRHALPITDSRFSSAKKSRKHSRDLCSRCDTHLVYETWAACSQEYRVSEVFKFSLVFCLAI